MTSALITPNGTYSAQSTSSALTLATLDRDAAEFQLPLTRARPLASHRPQSRHLRLPPRNQRHPLHQPHLRLTPTATRVVRHCCRGDEVPRRGCRGCSIWAGCC
jgi:hypothetical protein